MARSPVAHARLASIDIAKSSSMPGVHTVLTGEDISRHSTPTPIGWEHIADQRRTESLAMATSTVRYVGHIVAAVVAETRAIAEDAVDAIEIDYDLLPAVMDVDAAREPNAPILHSSWPDNVLATDQQTSGDVPVAAWAIQILSATEAKEHPALVVKLIALGMPAKIIVVIKNQNSGIGMVLLVEKSSR